MFPRAACLLLGLALVAVPGHCSSCSILGTAQATCVAANTVAYYDDNVKELRETTELLLEEPELAAVAQLVLGRSDDIKEKVEALQSEFEKVYNQTGVLLKMQDNQKDNMYKLISIDPTHYEVSNARQGRFYIVNKADEAFDLHKKNQVCKTHGGYLVEIDDTEEQDFVWDFAKAFGIDNYYFTGGNDAQKEGTFVWYNSGKPVTNIKWKPGEPNNSGGNEDCMNIRIHGLNDASCVKNARYICEIPLDE